MNILKSAIGAFAIATATFAALPAAAQDPGPEAYKNALEGKRIVIVPMAMGFDLAQGWAGCLSKEIPNFGGVFETRDPNWSVEAGAQAIAEAITSDPKPDVLIVMAPDMNSYSKLMRRAQKAGIFVFLIDNPANFKADAFFGGDWTEMGRIEAKEAVRACGEGSSKQIGLVQGDQTNATLKMVDAPSAEAGSGTKYELNSKLSQARSIGLGEVEGPEDVVLDRNDNLYCGTRHGEVVRFFAPDYTRWEVFAHVGGFPLGLAFDKDENLISCVGAMGPYSISPDRKVTRLTAETRRSLTSIVDDAVLRDPTDLDIAPDGKIYFTDSTKRYDAHDWTLDSIENRGTGRLLVYNPEDGSTKTLLDGYHYTNGVTIAHDNKSLLFCETWSCRIHRYWLEGPKKGKAEILIDDLPGYPDNINRASDGTYWMAWLGMRTPSFDLSLRHPDFRKRMTRRLPQDEWLFANVNNGGVIKFDDSGKILMTLGDLDGKAHPSVTSMREHKGQLFIGGILNNRIGVFDIEGADQNWTAPVDYWGEK